MKMSIRMSILGAALLLAFGALAYGQMSASAAGFVQGNAYYLTSAGAAVQAGQPNATTTKHYFSASTASSTITGLMLRSDQIDLQVRGIASTSVATLRYAIYESDNAVDWYPVESATTTTALPTVASNGPILNRWNLSTTTSPTCFTNEVCKAFTIKGFYAKYFRIEVAAESGSAAIWAKATPRDWVNN